MANLSLQQQKTVGRGQFSMFTFDPIISQWVNESESVLTVWVTHNDSKVSYCLYLIIPMLN